jgi:hypothetical protein
MPTSPNRNVAGNHSASFIGSPPGFEIDDVSLDRILGFELSQRGTRSFGKGVEASRAIRSSHRTPILVEHYDFLFADQKVPSAPNAVVEPRLMPKQWGIAQRPDNKFVPKAWRMPRWAENVAFPKLHEKALNAFSGPHGKALESKAELRSDH